MGRPRIYTDEERKERHKQAMLRYYARVINGTVKHHEHYSEEEKKERHKQAMLRYYYKKKEAEKNGIK